MTQLGDEVNELSELRKRAETFRYQYTLTDQSQELALIEQALLAERKSVWEEAAKIADECDYHSTDACECWRIAKSIRAAAEKE